MALSILKIYSCLLIPHLKRKKLQKGTSMVTHSSNLPYKRDVSIPSQNVSHNSLIWARNLPSASQKMVFLTQQSLMIKELQTLLEKQKGLLHPGSKHCMTPGEKTSLWMNVGWENKDMRMVLMRHNLCVFPVIIMQFHSHDRNSFGNRSLSIRVLNNFQVLMPPGTPSKVVWAIRHFCFTNQSLKHTGKINYPGTALSRSPEQHLPWYITFPISLLKLGLTLQKGACRYPCQLQRQETGMAL